MALYEIENAPVTEPYVRDLILEAQKLLTASHPQAENLHFVEFYEDTGMALIPEQDLLLYNPDSCKQLSLNDLCKVLDTVLVRYGQLLIDECGPLAGTTLH